MPTVTKNSEEQRFQIDDGGTIAMLTYHEGKRHITLVHTEVPEALAGRGLGGKLVRAAIDVAEADGLTVVPQCEFARGWLESHPDVASRVNLEWPPH